MHNIYGMRPGDVFWAASDVGWVVGHSYIVYGPLLAGCTSVIYEGKPIHTPGMYKSVHIHTCAFAIKMLKNVNALYGARTGDLILIMRM